MSESNLPKKVLGRTGMAVSTLGYGAMALDQERMAPRGLTLSDDQSGEILNAVLDNGINFIDTAGCYGTSEDLIGRFISHRRKEYFLASKCGCPAVEGAGARGGHIFSVENIRAGIERSLERMHTDYLDAVQFHGSPSEAEEEAAIATLVELRREGVVRFIGVSSTLPTLAHHISLGIFDVFQIPYSAVQREHEAAISTAAQASGGTIIRGGVARGAPSEEKDWAQRLPEARAVPPQDTWEKAALDDLLDGASRMEFILRFTLSHPDLHTTIVGTGKVDHLQANLDAARKGPLPEAVYAEAKRRLDVVGGS